MTEPCARGPVPAAVQAQAVPAQAGPSQDAGAGERPATPARTTIFVTVGAQMSFDRLVTAVDAWAAQRPDADVFAQIGPDGAEPAHLRWTRFLGPEDFRRRVAEAGAVVSHAGMGTILTALEYRKPIVVMPRRGELRETRNDHQVATAERFRALGRVRVAQDERELGAWLDRVAQLRATEAVPPRATPALLGALRTFVLETYARKCGAQGPGGRSR